MSEQELQATLNAVNDTFLEETIDAHYDQTDEDLETVNRVISYRKMTVPLQVIIKDHHYATVLRKTGSLPAEILYNKDYCEIGNFFQNFTIGEDYKMSFLVVLTRASKFDKKMGKASAFAAMDLKEIYERFLKDTDLTGIMIFGGENPYPVSFERIKSILKISK